MSEQKQIGRSLNNPHIQFSQTELQVHEEWAHFTIKSGAASALVHMLIKLAGADDVVVASQRALSEVMGLSQSTINRAIKDASEAGYIEIVRLGATGRGACAYRLNSRVHWTKSRSGHQYFSSFRATVVALGVDQTTPPELEKTKLRKVPVIKVGEVASPSGDGMPPPSQIFLDGFMPSAVEV